MEKWPVQHELSARAGLRGMRCYAECSVVPNKSRIHAFYLDRRCIFHFSLKQQWCRFGA